jgi:co-chaperonin GroES (HSP10)
MAYYYNEEVMTKKFIQPFYDRVVLSLVKEEKTEGGLYLSKSATSTMRAEVVAMGPGKYDLDKEKYLTPPMKVGDVVVINPMLGGRIKLERGGEEYVIQGVDEILGLEVTAEKG